ncbi:JAB domain-containing protein [Flavobacteriales bacterium]|nr:JAB domain-containing protein [Flavobacteriales bacterium]
MKHINTTHEIQVNYERNYGNSSISNSHSAAETCRKAFKLSNANLCLKEYFFIVLLNRANQVIGYHKLSDGGLNGTVADVRLAFSIGLKCLASGMIITHNHPSSSLKPSNQDQALTNKFVEVGKVMDIKVLDHIILTETGYYSFADNGLL